MRYVNYLLLVFSVMIFSVQAQNNDLDLLVLTNGKTHSVTIRKVEPETITYSFAGEELENVVEKTNIEKIIFKSGREQMFTATKGANDSVRHVDFEYPTMKSNEGAVLPFEFVFDGTPEDGTEAQEYYYNNLLRKPERNTIHYQDAETTQKRLRTAGIDDAMDMRDYDMAEIAKIVGAGMLVTGKITVDYRSTSSTTTGSTTTRVDTKKKKVKTYSSDNSYSTDEYDTKVIFRIYDKDGNKIVDETRRPFMATTRENYVTALNYFMKRTPYYQK